MLLSPGLLLDSLGASIIRHVMDLQGHSTPSADVMPRRIANACAQCRERKVRCDGGIPSCERCQNSKTTCRYDKRKGRGLGKSKQYISSLEQRLKEAGISSQAPPVVNQGSSHISADTHDSDDQPHLNATTAPNRSQTPPSRWPREIAKNMARAQENRINLDRMVYVPLPPKEYMFHFIFSAMEEMYLVRPLFGIDEISKLVEDQFVAGLNNCHENPTRWATLNALIAMSIHWKADNSAIKDLFPVSWSHFKNAYAIFPELVMKVPSIESCQAILVMALFMQGTADGVAFTSLLSAATHAAQCIGLHLEDGNSPRAGLKREKRRRIFWLIHVLQCNASLKFELPAPSGEIDVNIPSQDSLIGGSTNTGLLRHMSTLSLIQSRIIRELRPGSGLWKNHDEMRQVIAEIDHDLTSWLAGLPSEFQPTFLSPVMTPIVAELQFAYYASTWRIHSANDIIESIQKLSTPASSLRLLSPTPTDSARAAISLIKRLSPQPLVILWRFMCYPVCAMLILLATVLDNPGSSEADSNMAWIDAFLRSLQNFQNREGCDLKSFIDGCSKLYKVASHTQRKSSGPTDECENTTTELPRGHVDIYTCLKGSIDAMPLTQGLLTNMPLLSNKARNAFSSMSTGMMDDEYGLLVPDLLKPSTFNFCAS
ncbi:hypothetical protein DER45DRAFT_579133 [Fusarium avenaceum]|nr:hypothetical protein DER45DRAFT_579133 [Fusarium avenaceum]